MDTVILIPAFHPDEKLLQLLVALSSEKDRYSLVIVDDGSGQEYKELFDRAACYGHVLRHEVNRGKGAAIKTGIAYVKEKMPEIHYLITADADGQHLPTDISRLFDFLHKINTGFVIGARNFEGKVPLRSRFGNSVTKLVFLIAAGKKCSDTQTGLRGFSSDLFDTMLSIKGDRYEYEMNVLMHCAQNGVKIQELPIRTVYTAQNTSSHFRAIVDSYRIYKIIFCNSSLVRYGLSALFCFALDFAALSIFRVFFPKTEWLYVLLARCISAPVNYLINRVFVFHSNAHKAVSFLSYLLLAGTVIVAKMGLMELLVGYLHWNYALSDILVEVGIFISNFIIQKLVIFRKKKH